MGKRACVIGGGGAFGAITIGNAKRIGQEYDYVIGVSTGAIMACLFALGEAKHDKLRDAYINCTNKDVYKLHPFTRNGDISIYDVVKRAVLGYISIGDMSPMLSLVRRWLTKEDFIELQDSGKVVIVALLNVTTGRVEYKRSDEHDYLEFTTFIYAASCPELIGNLTEINGWEYGDSGLATLVPIVKATKMDDVSEIDVYVHREGRRPIKNSQILDMKVGSVARMFMFSLRIIKAIFRYVLIIRENLEYKEQREGVLRAILKGKEITCYYMDSTFRSVNSLVMNPSVMKKMYEHGLQNGMKKVVYTKDNWEDLFDPQDDE